MKKKIITSVLLALALSVTFIANTKSATATSATQIIEMYRLYNSNSGEHFYTAKAEEKDYLVKVGWNDEGIGWYAPSLGDPVYRVYNPNSGDHHYTLKEGEKDILVSLGWKDEGIGWYSVSEGDRLPLYRQYNPNAITGNHNYTLNEAEKNNLISLGWNDEGIGWYAINRLPINITVIVPTPTPAPTATPSTTTPSTPVATLKPTSNPTTEPVKTPVPTTEPVKTPAPTTEPVETSTPTPALRRVGYWCCGTCDWCMELTGDNNTEVDRAAAQHAMAKVTDENPLPHGGFHTEIRYE